MDLLHFVIPGLFYPQLRGVTREQVDVDAPSLEWLLHRSKRHSSDADCIESALLDLFGIRGSSDLPVAPISYHADFGAKPKHWCMHADPVYMVPQGDGLVLERRFAEGEISHAEADKIADQFNQIYSDLELRLIIAPDAPHRWYLESAKQPLVQTHPLYHVVGRDINPYLPFGHEEQKWHQLLNEIQMLLHSSEVNQQRGVEGKQPINSVWFWGEGEMPVMSTRKWDTILTNHRFARTIAKLGKTEVRECSPSALAELLNDTSTDTALWLMDTSEVYSDFDNWQQTVERLEQQFFVDLQQAIQDKKLQHLILDTGLGTQFHITPALSWRVWQRKKHFTDYLNAI